MSPHRARSLDHTGRLTESIAIRPLLVPLMTPWNVKSQQYTRICNMWCKIAKTHLTKLCNPLLSFIFPFSDLCCSFIMKYRNLIQLCLVSEWLLLYLLRTALCLQEVNDDLFTVNENTCREENTETRWMVFKECLRIKKFEHACAVNLCLSHTFCSLYLSHHAQLHAFP